MCGIAGYVGQLTPHQGRGSLKVMQHRGPDGLGEWFNGEDSVWLGHARLAIIDREGGSQPFSNQDRSIWVTFNGCIYNYKQVREELISKGYSFQSRSDTEVLIHAYEEYGESCVSRLCGMFAFAIWDSRQKKLFCARDRVGQKPFYYFLNQNTFCFASEIKGLLAMEVTESQLDMVAFREYLTFQMTLDEKTLFKNIFKLLPGYTLTYDAVEQRCSLKKYWDVDYLWNEHQTESVYLEALRELLVDSVRSQMTADVPVGAYLSGGLDSSLIVGLMSQLNSTHSKINTYTGLFKEGLDYDESHYARIMSIHAGTNYHESILTSSDFLQSLQKLIYHMDEPTAGPGAFPQYMVAKAASQDVKVVLGGQGGDEIFAGYARYQLGQLEDCLKHLIKGKEDVTPHLATMMSLAPNLRILDGYDSMMKSFWSDGLFDAQEKRYYRLMNRSQDYEGLFQADFWNGQDVIMDQFSKVFYGSNASTFLERMQYFDLKTHLQSLCHVEDRMNMAWGIESRSPLLDHRIIELMATIPASIKFKAGSSKQLLKDIGQDVLHQAVLSRKDKMGFPVPLNHWAKHDLKEEICDILLNPNSVLGDFMEKTSLQNYINNTQYFSRGLWGLINVELWFQTFMSQTLKSNL
jgi:asparagine synthase (glutamine-hydrolysing)